MSENTEEVQAQPSTDTVDPTQEMFKVLSEVVAAEPAAAPTQRTEVEQELAMHVAQEELVNLAVKDTTLVHAASAVFNELRYYDAIRLRAYAFDIYKKLTAEIGTTGEVPLIVKKTLPPLNSLALPNHINPNELPTKVTVSVFHREPCVDVEIEYAYRSGKNNTFTTRTRYAK